MSDRAFTEIIPGGPPGLPPAGDPGLTGTRSPLFRVPPRPQTAGLPFGPEQPHPPWTPDVNAYEVRDQLVIEVDLPGVLRDDVSVHVTAAEADQVPPATLVVFGRRGESHTADRTVLQESSRGDFLRAFAMPAGYLADSADVELTRGVLTIRVQWDGSSVGEDSRQPRALAIRQDGE